MYALKKFHSFFLSMGNIIFALFIYLYLSLFWVALLVTMVQGTSQSQSSSSLTSRPSDMAPRNLVAIVNLVEGLV